MCPQNIAQTEIVAARARAAARRAHAYVDVESSDTGFSRVFTACPQARNKSPVKAPALTNNFTVLA